MVKAAVRVLHVNSVNDVSGVTVNEIIKDYKNIYMTLYNKRTTFDN